ncbi:signal recognition particle-docking protein FtsY [Nitrospirillum pindoramense]|uniref:Signal recognition particle receptor FtsY n=2 Tax=Nitrospirillum amazonense TaxID=28077 RepID=A0A560HG32_9PROT|nr:signal recognition particle-docking protein FtsY [Nitrospirillum amazonense]TWB45392.1 signal recognition particle-docking protein FtsY [Nitrospirillum amazonense]
MFDWIKRKKPAAEAPAAPPTPETPVAVEPVAQPEQLAPEPLAPEQPAPVAVEAPPAPVVPKSALVLDAAPVAPVEEAPQGGWLSRLRRGLSKSTSRLTDGIGGIFTKRKLDDETLEELEELLIQADLGPAMAARVTGDLAKSRFGKEISPDEVKRFLADEIAKVLVPVAQPLVLDGNHKPHVVLVVGVNGTGKTTTIGKYARELRAAGKTVWLAAGDTFRAAAVSQLQIWGERTGAPVIAKETGADAAGLAYEALEKARAAGADVLLIDTAGRLQNKQGLMDELRKIVRVIKKVDPTAPHTTLLTLDATTGQNAHSQVEVFKEMVSVNGLILTKLDGSARGGVLVSLAQKFGLPVHAIGVGEGIDDLRPFDAQSFAASLVGLDEGR